MYEFNYGYIKNKYCNKSRLLFTDIDTLLYDIETENVYDDFCKNEICLILVIILMIQMHKLLIKCKMKWAAFLLKNLLD